MSELQSNVNNLADVMVFLEVLGFNNEDAKKGGFTDLFDLARHVYQRVDYYDEESDLPTAPSKDRVLPVPSTRKRLVESLSLATPWLGGLALLYAFGVSLWLAWGLPIASVTALMVGVLLGLLISEGPLQAFTRIFMFYHAQGNVSECSRVLKRSYLALCLLLLGSVAVLMLTSRLLSIPAQLAWLAAVGTVTISLHRIGFLPIYALKRTKAVVASYGVALPLLAGTYLATSSIFPDPVIRYLLSLSMSLTVLSAFAWYYSTKALVVEARDIIGKGAPTFFKPAFVNVDTIRSKFSVQFWEALPQYLFGTFFFVMVFGDRVLSWISNPTRVVGGIALPMLFNSVYHSGADMALGILFPVAIVLYVMLSSIHEELNNISLRLTVTETKSIDSFIRGRFISVMSGALVVSAAAAFLVIIFGPMVITRYGGSAVSVRILYIAALADICLTVFVVNSSFMMLLNRPKTLAGLAMAGAVIVVAAGAFFSTFGFQYIVYAYLGACVFTAFSSSFGVAGLLETPSSLFLSKFV